MDKISKVLREKINKKQIRIAVVGLGYVGLPLAMAFAKKGLRVTGIEIDKDRLCQILDKKSYIIDVPQNELKKVINSGRLTATGDFKVLNNVDVIIICVPTPLKRKYAPDITYIKQAVKAISKNIRKDSLVILESTTYPGTTEEEILPLLEKRNFKHNRDFFLCFSPERIDPGNKQFPVNKIPKIVGGLTKEATQLAVLVYRMILKKVVPVSSTRTAEAAKLLENTFRLVNIGLVDEMAMMAHEMGMDIWEIIRAASTKPFGFMPFYPGPGVGGHCIPKDPLYLYWKAKSFGFRSRFIKLASEVISNMPGYIADRLEILLKEGKAGIRGARILVMGVTYKKDTKDLRKSPSIDIIDILQKRRAKVQYHDPLIPYLKIEPDISLKCMELSRASLRGFDCVVIATDHSKVDYDFVLKNSKLIFDTRNVYRRVHIRKVHKL